MSTNTIAEQLRTKLTSYRKFLEINYAITGRDQLIKHVDLINFLINTGDYSDDKLNVMADAMMYERIEDITATVSADLRLTYNRIVDHAPISK